MNFKIQDLFGYFISTCLLIASTVTFAIDWEYRIDTTHGGGDGSSIEITGCQITCPAQLIIPDEIDGLPVTKIGYPGFRNEGITNVQFGENIITLDNFVFAENQLTYVSLPSSVETIGDYTFYRNYSLQEVAIPNNVTTIGNLAFAENGMSSIQLGSNVETIGTFAFYQNNIKSLVLPEKITSIGDFAFGGNPLEDVHFLGDRPQLFDYSLGGSVYSPIYTYCMNKTGWPGDYIFNGVTPVNDCHGPDDDNDGVVNAEDSFPLDPLETIDADSDGVGDNADAFPLDPLETLDTDNDGIGNNTDTDDDGDGIEDLIDAFPLDATEAIDTDGDGIGNNTDTDDDNDGIADDFDDDADNDGIEDSMDVYPLNEFYSKDIDQDGLPDEYEDIYGLNKYAYTDALSDVDNDGLTALQEFELGTSPVSDDTDLDALPDGWEVESNRDPLVADFELSLGESFTCARIDSDVSCWGRNGYGQTDVPELSNPSQISAGEYHSCAIDDSGVVCWGKNNNGRTNVPGGLDNPTLVAAGPYFTCAIDDSGVVCWGLDSYGQEISDVPELINPTQLSLGTAHVCALDDYGVTCWGDNYLGQLNVPNLSNPRQISGGDYHTCALDDSGVVCWSWDSQGQSEVPNFLENPTYISAGRYYSCAIDDNGVTCWGSEFAAIGELSYSKKIWTGRKHTCVLDGFTAKCWGENDYAESDLTGLIVDPDGDGFSSLGGNITHTITVAFPLDSTEWLDTDNDGLGNNADTDDDGDGTEDIMDAFPLDSSETNDNDNDGVGDNADTDDDNDGVEDLVDAFPFDAFETTDTDGDGVGNNTDDDDDGDGVNDVDDVYPLNELYHSDLDSDGMADAWEVLYGLNPDDPLDTISDQDNDGSVALQEFIEGTIPGPEWSVDDGFAFFEAFDGAEIDGSVFTFPSSADSWAGFANINTSLYPMTVSENSLITFTGSVPSGGDAVVRFTFETNPFPNNYPLFNTETVTVSGAEPATYSITVPSQGANIYNSFIMYLDTRDVGVSVTNVVLASMPLSVVTFSVDMSGVDLQGQVPTVNGPFNAWCGACAPMTDEDGDNIWTTELALDAGEWDYKFVLGEWVAEETVSAFCGTPRTYEHEVHVYRTVTVEEATDLVLDVTPWSGCPNTAYTPADGLKFSEAFGGAEISDDGLVYTFPSSAGDWAGFANINTTLYPMTIVEESVITFTGSVPAGGDAVVRFRFEANPHPNTEPSFDTGTVTVSGADSATYSIAVPSQGANTFNSFIMYLDTRDVGVSVTNIVLASVPLSVVTFSVDMSGVDLQGQVPTVNGTFNGWCGDCAPMSDEDGDNIWTAELALDAGDWDYKFVLGDWVAEETVSAFCGAPRTDENQNTTVNRTVTVEEATDLVLDVTPWSGCPNTAYTPADGFKFSEAFGGAEIDGSVFTFPSSAGDWAGFANINTTLYPMTIAVDSVITFTGSVPSGGDAVVRFRFEANPYPNTEPSFDTGTVTVSGAEPATYSIFVPYRNNGFNSLIMYLDTRDVGVSLSDIAIEDISTFSAHTPADGFTFLETFGAEIDSSVYTFPSSADSWAGFANINTSLYPMTVSENSLITFTGSVPSGGDAVVRFRFEANPFPNNYPLFNTETVTVSGAEPATYSITVPSQGPNIYNSFIMYLDTRDVGVSVTNVVLAPMPLSIVTFSVDMSGVDLQGQVLSVNGSFNAWCGTCAPMTDDDGDDIWTTELALDAGYWDYKFVLGDWVDAETVSAACGTPTDEYGVHVNRTITVEEATDLVLDVTPWSGCPDTGYTPADGFKFTEALFGTEISDDGSVFTHPSGAYSWAYFANKNTTLYPMTVTEESVITFTGYVPSGGDAVVRFHFEANRYPHTEPSFATGTVTVSGTEPATYSITVPSQGRNIFNSINMHLDTQDVDVSLTDIAITDLVDSDNDGVGDHADAFPNDASETADSDNDGVGDNADFAPNDPSVTASGSWDFDEDGKADALTDGLMLLRYTFNLKGASLTAGAVSSDSPLTHVEVEANVAEAASSFADIDGNGEVDALTDGLLLLRYLFNMRGDALIAGAIAGGAERSSATDIKDYIVSHMP